MTVFKFNRFKFPFTVCVWICAGLTTPTWAQTDNLSRELLDTVFPKPQTGAEGPKLETTFEPVPGAVVGAKCELSRVDVIQTLGATVRRFGLLMGPNNASPVEAEQIVIRMRRLTVDADGSARAYHPEDPTGSGICARDSANKSDPWKGVCALDHLNSASIRIYRGLNRVFATIDGKSNPEYAAAWKELWPLISSKQLRPVDLKALMGDDAPKKVALYYSSANSVSVLFNNTDIIPFKDSFPCIRSSFPKGYFVAATAFKKMRAGNTRRPADVCDPDQYLDAMDIPFFVLPGRMFKGIKVGDLAIGHASVGGESRYAFGIVGDTGPYGQAGEGSLAFNSQLLNRKATPMNSSEVNRLDIDLDHPRQRNGDIASISVLLLGNSAAELGGNYSRENIEKVGKAALERWNGALAQNERLNDCVQSAPENPHQGLK